MEGYSISKFRSKSAQQATELLNSQLALLEQCGNYDEFLDQIEATGAALHPLVLIKQLGRERVTPEGKPLLHHAIALELENENLGGHLNWRKLVQMGFETDVKDENGQTALHQIFKPHKL